jgi:hypothetical protein
MQNEMTSHNTRTQGQSSRLVSANVSDVKQTCQVIDFLAGNGQNTGRSSNVGILFSQIASALQDATPTLDPMMNDGLASYRKQLA